MDDRQKFLEKATKEREERQRQNVIKGIVDKIQAHSRGYIYRKKFRTQFLNEFETKFALNTPTNVEMIVYGNILLNIENVELFPRIGYLCRAIAHSMFNDDENITFAVNFIKEEYRNRAIREIKRIFIKGSELLATVDLDKVSLHKASTTIVLFFIVLTTPEFWNYSKKQSNLSSQFNTYCEQYSKNIIEVEQLVNLSKFLSICTKRSKPSQYGDFINKTVTTLFRVFKKIKLDNGKIFELIIENTFICPGLLKYLDNNTMNLIKEVNTFEKLITMISSNPNYLNKFNILQTLNFLANFILISCQQQNILGENLLEWVHGVNNFFTRIQSLQNVSKKPYIHCVLGSIPERLDSYDEASSEAVKTQLRNLWSKKMVTFLFDKALSTVDEKQIKKTHVHNERMNNDFLNRIMKKISISREHQPDYSVNFNSVSLTAVLCQLYQNAIIIFEKLHTDIIGGLCVDNSILKQLWNFICLNSPKGPTHYLLSLFSADPTGNLPYYAVYSLFAHIAYTQIYSLDEQEMYEDGIPFNIEQLRDIAYFSNCFCFKVIWDGLIVFNEPKGENIFFGFHKLCMLLHNRDSRRSFVADDKFWHAPDVKPSTIINEFEKKIPRGLKLMSLMPHLVPLKERLLFFRRLVSADKKETERRRKNNITTLVTIGRKTLIEDGYRQISQMSSTELKVGFRIKFVNFLGLDEAGIDQDGVFKEFLELTMKGIFNPELNLFKETTNGQFYPSYSSGIHDHHLEYFHHIGRMLGKAVYDGFVIDIQLAPVLLATILKKRLCAFDELATVDPDMYKNLSYVKKYSETADVGDLELTFSVDEEMFGKVQTIDLPGGGRYTKVTNENRMNYVHQVAYHKIFKRTQKQTESFVKGFKSIINQDWLALFNTHELQSLISGIKTDIDVPDLKKNVQYYGGFHSNHRVIKWLWEIVEYEFTKEERALFLKFVTSCSRAPLLGFAYLEPPFSIRCVEVSDDQDQGDTLGSVVRGFLAIKRSKGITRLPTSSTCFNLLKLPNYCKKSLLSEKLKYAIKAEAGFELS